MSACVCDQRFCPCLFVCLLLFVVVVCVHDQYLTLLCVCLFVSLIMFLFVVVVCLCQSSLFHLMCPGDCGEGEDGLRVE